MKTSELNGALLDFWAARASGEVTARMFKDVCYVKSEWFQPSNKWADGGPIIQREGIDIIANGSEWDAGFGSYIESSGEEQSFIEWIEMEAKQSGPRPLIAAMRALVCRKFGADVPDDHEAPVDSAK